MKQMSAMLIPSCMKSGREIDNVLRLKKEDKKFLFHILPYRVTYGYKSAS